MDKEEKLILNYNVLPTISTRKLSPDGHVLEELTVVGYELDEVKKIHKELSKDA